MVQLVAAGLVGLAVWAVLLLVMKRRLLIKYAALWTCVVLVLLVVVAFPNALDEAAQFLGFEVTSNFLFFAAITLLLAICLNLSVAATINQKRQQRLAEELVLLEARLLDLESDDEADPDNT